MQRKRRRREEEDAVAEPRCSRLPANLKWTMLAGKNASVN